MNKDDTVKNFEENVEEDLPEASMEEILKPIDSNGYKSRKYRDQLRWYKEKEQQKRKKKNKMARLSRKRNRGKK